MQPSPPSRAWGCAHTQTHTDCSAGRRHAWAHVPTAAAAGPRGLTGLCTLRFSHQGLAAAPTPSQAHLHKEKRPDLAPASGLGEGAVSGQVAALDGQRVVAHPQDGDAQGKDQGPVRAQAQEPCGGGGGGGERVGCKRESLKGGGSFSDSWRSEPKRPSLHPWKPGPKRAQPWGLPRTAMWQVP